MAFKMNPKSPLLMKAMGAASPAKQTAKQKANLPKEIVKAIGKGAAKAGAKAGAKANEFAKNNSDLVTTGKPKSPAKQKEQDPTQIPGNQVRSYSKGGSIKAPKVSYDMAYEKRDKKKYGDMKKADYIKEAKRQTKSKLETNDWDVNPRKKVKKTTTLKAEKIKTSKPKGNLVDAKEIKVTKKVTKAKPTRSQKLRAKGEAAVASGNTDKAQRLRKRMDRVDARKAKRAARKAAKA